MKHFIDKDGYKYKINYIRGSCMCAMDCGIDILEIYEDDDPIACRLEIEGSDVKYFIQGLLDGEITRINS